MSTALQPMDPQRAAVIEERRAQNRMMQQIRGATWSKDLDRDTALAVAEYCRRNDIDAATEVEILGGRIYKNANWYERKGAELMAAGLVTAIEADHIAADARLDATYQQALAFAADSEQAGDPREAEYWRQQAREIRRETVRRSRARVEHNAPEKAAAVVVTTVTLSTGVTVTGVNWCGNGVRQRDPVGDAEPTKTAETRSARRAWKKLAGAAQSGHVQHPALQALAAAARTDDDDSLAVEAVIADAAARTPRLAPMQPIQALAAGDEYGTNEETLTAGTVPAPTDGSGVPVRPRDAGGSVFLPDGGAPAGATPANYSREELDAVPALALDAVPALALGDAPVSKRRDALAEG